MRGEVEQGRDGPAAAGHRPLGGQRIGLGGGPTGHPRRAGDGDDRAVGSEESRLSASTAAPSSAFFRYFSDKRELLVAGQETLSRLLAEGIAEAPASASPLQAVAAGLERAAGAMGPANRELGPRIAAAVAASTELQERDVLKSVGLAAAMTDALLARAVPKATALLAGELGVLAFKQGYARWSEDDSASGEGEELAAHALAALEELKTAAASLDR